MHTNVICAKVQILVNLVKLHKPMLQQSGYKIGNKL